MCFNFIMGDIITQAEASKNSAALTSHGKFCYQDIATMDDHNFIELLQEAGVKSIYNVPIKTLNGRIIGILGVDYVKAQMKCDVENETSLQFMKRQARIVSGYLL